MIDSHWIDFAHSLADKAGELLLPAFEQLAEVSWKPDASPVTETDKQVEIALRDMITREFPAHMIWGEEMGKQGMPSRWKWVIDPIDGTKSFVAGYPLFCCLISLCDNGVPVLGVVDQPVLKQRWVGVSGAPATYNGHDIVAQSGSKPLGEMILNTTAPEYFSDEGWAHFSGLRERIGTCIYGGDAYAYAQMAQGRVDIVMDEGLNWYDVAALIPMVEGAGGCITDWQGKPLTMKDGKLQVLACRSKDMHADVLQWMQAE